MRHPTWTMRQLDALFAFAERASGGYWVRRLGRDDDIKAAQWLDAYVFAWVTLELGFLAVSPRGLPVLFAIPAGYRLLEIAQVFVNGLLFDARRFEAKDPKGRRYKVQSGERTVVQYVVLFLEIPLLFAIFYFLLRHCFEDVTDATDALAFSFGTLTTLGDPSGESHVATGGWRFLPLGEVMFGFLVGVIVLGRVISVLPPVGALDRPERDSSARAEGGPATSADPPTPPRGPAARGAESGGTDAEN